jgi:glyoxylase-like metal-dependent hydrolase (beta-lactamase superfamily II)
MTMIIKKLAVGQLEVNCYIIGDEKSGHAITVDPGDEPDRITEIIKKTGLEVRSIICTHAHFDHIGAVGDVKDATGARVLIHRDDKELYENAGDQAAIWGYKLEDNPQPDGYLEDGDNLTVGNLNFRVLHTPGHSPGGICLLGEGILCSGDTLFQGSVGRTDFPGGDQAKLKESFKRLLDLPENIRVLPGHGPETDIGRERRDNYFVSEWL